MKPNPPGNPAAPETNADNGFRRVIILSTALLLATVFGWLACMVRDQNGAVEFHWQWRACVWIAIGIGSTVYFWRQVWSGRAVPRSRKQQLLGWIVLAIPCLMWMAYPLRFISGAQLLNVGIGLSLAAVVLAAGGCMVFKLIKGFDHEEPPESKE